MDIKKLIITVQFKIDTGSLKKVDKATTKLKSSLSLMAAKAKKVIRVFTNMRGQMDKLSQTADALVNTFRKSFIILMSLWALGKFAGSFVKAAGEVEEMLNAMDIAFGNSKNEVLAWADSYAKATGRSKFELREMAGQFALVMKPNITDMETLVRLSTGLAERATDMASALQEVAGEGADVRKAIISALTGETETIKRWSINLKKEQLQREARGLGFTKQYKAMTEAERIELRYQVIMRQTSHLMGDAVKTRYQYTNTMKNLAGVVKDLQRAIGKGLLPMALKLSNWFIDVTREMLNWVEVGNRMEAMLVTLGVIVGVLAAQFIVAFLPLVIMFAALAWGFTEFYKVVQDFMVFMEGGDSVFGRWLKSMDITKESLKEFGEGWRVATEMAEKFFGVIGFITKALGELIGQMAGFLFLMSEVRPLSERVEIGKKKFESWVEKTGNNRFGPQARDKAGDIMREVMFQPIATGLGAFSATQAFNYYDTKKEAAIARAGIDASDGMSKLIEGKYAAGGKTYAPGYSEENDDDVGFGFQE